MSSPAHEDPSHDDALAPDKQSLSAHMLALIEVATVEERRTTDTGSAPDGKRRRRTDEPMQLDVPPAA